MKKVAAMGWKVPPNFVALTIHLYCDRIWELEVHLALHQAHMERNSPGNPSQKLEAYEDSTDSAGMRREREIIAITCLSHFCSMITCICEHNIISELSGAV